MRAASRYNRGWTPRTFSSSGGNRVQAELLEHAEPVDRFEANLVQPGVDLGRPAGPLFQGQPELARRGGDLELDRQLLPLPQPRGVVGVRVHLARRMLRESSPTNSHLR